MLSRRIMASLMAVIVVLTMSCCASLQASITSSHATLHACCDKDKDSKKKKDSSDKQHLCQCDQKLVAMAEQEMASLQNVSAIEFPTIQFVVVQDSQAKLYTIAVNSPPGTPALRILHCTYLI